MHYGNIFEYLSLWGEVQFLKIQKSKKKSKKSKNLTKLDFTPETSGRPRFSLGAGAELEPPSHRTMATFLSI